MRPEPSITMSTSNSEVAIKMKTPGPPSGGKVQTKPETMEESSIILPMMPDSVIALGDLWDCRAANSPGNIFSERFESRHLEAFPIQSLEYTMYQSRNTRDHIQALKVSAEVSVEMPNIKISGSAKFEREDTKKFNEEALRCVYKSSTFVVRVKNNAAELIDPIMKAKIEDGTCTATHYVQAIRLGAEATGDIRFYEKIDDTNLTIGGSFKAEMTFGPVTVKAQVSLEMLDKEFKEDYEVSVNAKARPRFSKAPTTVGEMFKEIDTLDAKLEGEQHFKEVLGPHIVGVPLSFTLVPITNLFLYDNSKLFRLMEEQIMNDFSSMIYTCQDYQNPHFIKGLLVEKEPRLVTILRDEFSPFTDKVSKLEIECAEKAKEVKAKAFEIYSLYKVKEKEAQDIQDVVSWYDDYFDVMTLTGITIPQLVQEGKKELNGIHASDAVNLSNEEDQPVIRFFTNETDLDDWWTAERSIKILLQTNLQGSSPSGTFLRLFNYSAKLAKLGVEVGIAFPNISKQFSLTFKIWDKLVVYEKEDISFALEVLSVAIETGNFMSSLFYRLTGVLSGLNLNSIPENLPDITALVTIFKESRGVNLCESYPQLISILTESTSMWNFVLPLQGLNNALETMKFFRQLRETLPNEYPRICHQWIVGTFNIQIHDSPLLLVFYENDLRAICLDHLDILILLNQFKLNMKNPDLSILSHDNIKAHCLYLNRANFAIKILEGLVLDHSTELSQLIPPLKHFPLVENDDLTKALEVTRTAATRDEIQVLNTIARYAIADLPDLHYRLGNFGWTDDGFLSIHGSTEWDKLFDSLQNFLGDQAPYLVKVEGAIQSLKNVKPPVEEDEPDTRLEKIKEIIKFITDFEKTENQTARSRIYKFLGTPIDEEEKFKNLKEEIDSFIECEDVGIILRGILNAFERFYNEEVNESLVFFHLIQLTLLVKELALKEKTFKPILVDIVKKYCYRKSLHDDVYPLFPNGLKKINDSLTAKNIFQTLDHLAKMRLNPNMYWLTEELYNLTTLTNIEPMKNMIENMRKKEFTEPQLKSVWLNPKFIYLIRQGIQSNEVLLETIFLELCADARPEEPDDPDKTTLLKDQEEPFVPNGQIPRFIPKDIEEKLKPYFYNSDEPQFYWSKEWENVEQLIQALQILVTRRIVPTDFSKVLRKHVEENSNLREALQSCGGLFYWDDENKLFKSPWGIGTIEKVLNLLMDATIVKPELKPLIEITQQEKTSNVTDNESSFQVTEEWKKFTNGGTLNIIQDELFEMINPLVAYPLVEYDNLSQTLPEIIPYLAQQARMHNSTTMQPRIAKKYIRYPPTDGKPRPGHIDFDTTPIKPGFLLSKGDLMTVLFNCAEPRMIHEMLQSMMKSKISLPLLIPGMNSAGPSFKLMVPELQNMIVHELESIVPQPHLLTYPFRLVFALRVGDSQGKLGKSTILNQLLMSNHNAFSCFAEPGVENGKPIARAGLIEFIWLAKSTVNPEFYDAVVKGHYAETNQPQMILLANLHGNALEFQPLLESIKTFASSFLVFWKANNWNELKAKKAELSKCIGNEGTVLDLVIYPDSTILAHVHEQSIIEVANPGDIEKSKVKLFSVFKEAIMSKPKNQIGIPAQDDSAGIMGSQIDPGILNFIGQCRSNNKISAQKFIVDFPDPDTAISTPESHKLIQFIRDVSCEKIKHGLIAPTLNQELLANLSTLFLALLNIPLPKRNLALTHFKYELDHLSRLSSAPSVERIVKLRKEMESNSMVAMTQEEILELQDEIKSILRRQEQTTLTMEDIFRYFIHQESLEEIMGQKYYEYMSHGHSIELFQPTHGLVMWDKMLESIIHSIPENTKVIVISMIGLKASGKSTLLNRLFGCSEFREGPAGCTMGLLMRLLWTNDQLKKSLSCDAFLIIDSEGFGAPENIIDESADLNERNLATFVLGISHLVIVNVMGESMKEMKDILEISFATLCRVKNIPIIPDVLLVQQQLEETMATPKEEHSPLFLTECAEFTQNVKTLTQNNEKELGVRVRATYVLEKLVSRFKHNELVHTIRPRVSNEEINSVEYHQDIRALYSRVLNAWKTPSPQSAATNVHTWYGTTEKYWNSICEVQSPGKFKNSTNAQDEINLEMRIQDLKTKIDMTFRIHSKIIEEEFNQKVDKFFNGEELQIEPEAVQDETTLILNKVSQELKKVINSCDIENGVPCKECLAAFTQRESLFQVKIGQKRNILIKEDISHYINEVRLSIYAKFNQRIVAKQIQTGKSRELKEVLEKILEEYSEEEEIAWIKFKQYISTRQSVIPPSDEIDLEFIKEFSSLPHILSRISTEHSKPDLESMIAFDLGHYNKALESFVNSPKHERLSWDQNDWLLANIEDIPKTLLTANDSNTYLVGMTREMHNKVKELLADFKVLCGEELDVDFKYEVYLLALKVFKEAMNKAQVVWNQENSPMIQLEQRKDEFPDLFIEY